MREKPLTLLAPFPHRYPVLEQPAVPGGAVCALCLLRRFPVLCGPPLHPGQRDQLRGPGQRLHWGPHRPLEDHQGHGCPGESAVMLLTRVRRGRLAPWSLDPALGLSQHRPHPRTQGISHQGIFWVTHRAGNWEQWGRAGVGSGMGGRREPGPPLPMALFLSAAGPRAQSGRNLPLPNLQRQVHIHRVLNQSV